MSTRRNEEWRRLAGSAIRICAWLVPAALAVTVAPATAQDGEEAAVGAVVQAFKDALRTGDGQAAVGLLHADVQVFEGGHAETLDEYRSGHLAADIGFLSAVESETTWEDIDVVGDLALYLSRYHTTGTYRDREIDAHGTETMVLKRTGDGWRIIHIHWSSR